jgi:hypothetical protein
MYTWHNHMSWITTFRKIDLFVPIAVLLQRIVSTPAISKYFGTWLDRIADERDQTASSSIRYALHSRSTESFWLMYFHSNHHDRFSSGSATAFATVFFSSNQGFIYFDITAKTFTPWSHHSTAHLMEPTPSSLVAPKAKNTLKAQCITPKFLTCYVPHRLKPQLERLPCSLKYRPGNCGYSALASGATNHPRFRTPAFVSLACRTDKTIRPTKPLEIIDACFLCGEPFVEFLQSSGVVYSANWKGVMIAHELTITLRQRNGYPPSRIY